MKTKLIRATIILFLIAMTVTGTVTAQNAIVGVNPGDRFDYNYSITWDSTNPGAQVPEADVDLNNTEFVRISIVNVTGTRINADFTRQYKNGTVIKKNGNIDVYSQILEIPYSVLIIRAFANTNEKIYPAGGYPTLSETEFRTTSVGRIETIHFLSPTTSQLNYERTEIFYDRTRGVGLEYNFEARETSGSYVTTTKVTLLLTSWVIPEFSSIFPLSLALIGIASSVIAWKKIEKNKTG
jgi:hypothetical protein